MTFSRRTASGRPAIVAVDSIADRVAAQRGQYGDTNRSMLMRGRDVMICTLCLDLELTPSCILPRMNETETMHARVRRSPGRVPALVALFLSTGTLVCCALPILLVTLGLGALVAGAIDAAPWLVTLSQHKAWLFAGTAVVLATAGWLVYRAGRECPADPALAEACRVADRWNRRALWAAATVWAVGAFTAYAFLPLRQALGV